MRIAFTPIEPEDIDPATNRFTTASGTAYNDNGQVVADGKFRNLGYGYDANGRTVRVSEANRPDAVSVYDALGNRVAEKVNDVWQFVIYDAFGKLVAEYGGNPQPDEGGVKYYMQDWQGSVRAGVNAGGYVRSRTDHQAFGEEIASGVGLRTTAQGFGAPQTNRQGFGLTEKDSATGLNHTWFRKNENRAGRWTSPDPYNGSASVGNPQNWNRYSYVANDPVNLVDPSGLIKLVCEYRFRTPLTCVIIDGHVDCEWDYAHADWGWVCTPEAGGSPSGYPEGPAIVEPGPTDPGRTNDCASFVNEIADNTEASYSAVGAGLSMIGESVRMLSSEKKPVSGFKKVYVDGGQDNDVYRHVLASAGSQLVDGLAAVQAIDRARQSIDNWRNGPGRDPERIASLRGNTAGIAVAFAIRSRFNGTYSASRLRDQLRRILCA